MKIISYSCKGLPNNASKLHNDDIDIICLQDTWFCKQDIGSLNTLHADCHGAATVDYMDHLGRAIIQVEWQYCSVHALICMLHV